MKRTSNPTRAFTLIELLVVISVVALLIGITMPALGHARESARRTKCLANLRSLGQGINLYLNESKGRFPYVRPLHNTSGLGNGNDPSLLELLPTYLDVEAPRKEDPNDSNSFYISADVFKCPSDLIAETGDQQWEPAWRTEGTSYEYVPGAFMLAAELLAVPNPAVGVTKAYEKGVERHPLPIMQDWGKWHKLRATGLPQNAVFFNDFHADWTIPIQDEAGRILEDARKYGGGGGGSGGT
jgi:prepilin-type N-terminal cleavage/methylation domain-containing protein